MFLIETYLLAVILSVITMICWGSWPNMQKLVNPFWRFELFYWDYVLGIVIITLLSAFTFGSFGSSGNIFLYDIKQAEWSSIFSAILGGVIFNAANILFVAAIAITGMSVAFPVGAGFGLILGVLINYIATPIGNVFYLFGGVTFIFIAIFLSAISHRRLLRNKRKISTRGIVLALLAGLLFGFFYRFIAQSMSTEFHLPEPGKLGPYSATVCFGMGVLFSNFIFNTLLMKKPVQGAPLKYASYFKGKSKDHMMGILGGMIWGAGLVLSILSAGKAGFAISFGLGQGNAMVAAIWGVFVWREFKEAPVHTNRFLYGMFSFYIFGLLLIILSRTI